MSFKFVSDLEFTPKTYSSLEELFNPTVNHCFRSGSNQLIVSDVLRFLKAAYQRQNIINYPREFFHDLWHVPGAEGTAVAPAIKEQATKFLADIPDDKLFWLNFLSLSVRGGIVAYRYNYTRDRGNSELFAPSTEYIPCDNPSGIRWTHRDAPSLLKGWIEQVEASWASRLEAVMTRRMHTESLSHTTQMGNMLWQMITNQAVYYDRAHDRRRTATQIATEMGTDIRLRVKSTPYGMEISCSVSVSRTNRTQIHRLLGYSTNPCDLLPWPLRLKNELPTSTLYGVELECSTDYSVRDIVDAAEEPFVLAKQDSSVTGGKSYMYELVTIPMSLRAHKQQWAKLFSKLDYAKFDTSNRTGNGMHVHIDRTAFSDAKHVRAMAWFFNNPANRPFMFELSERTLSSLQSYSPHFNIPNTMSKVKAFKDAYRLAGTCRGAVNVSKPATVEIRLFKGIVSYASVLKNLEAVDAALEFTRDANIQHLNLAGFVKWLNATPANKYGVLKKFIEQIKNMDELVEMSTMQEMIFTERDPDKIISIIKKKQVPVSSKTVTALNKIAGKRTFLLDSQNDDITVAQTNKGKVAFLDLELAKRYASVA